MTQPDEQRAAMTEQRAAFEAWADDQGYPLRRLDIGDGSSYRDLRTDGAWEAWQAALSALPAGGGAIPAGWTIRRASKGPFKRIELAKDVNGVRYGTVVDSMARNPENMLYMLADDLLLAAAPQQQENPK